MTFSEKKDSTMKKTYETPMAEKVSFCYSDQVVASRTDYSSGDNCVVAQIAQGLGVTICNYLPFNLE